MQLVGIVHSVGQINQVSDKFKKRDLIVVVAENPDYPEYIKIEFTQDKVDILDNFSAGQEVEVEVNLRGRLFTGKDGVETSFNSLVGWKINALTEADRLDVGEDVNSDDLPF